MELTKEQYQKLKPLEQHLIRAVRGNYVYGMTLKEAQLLFEIYNDVYDKNETGYACTRCRLNTAKRLGELYFKHQTAIKNKKAKKK